jgi:signal transduction histidine kinase
LVAGDVSEFSMEKRLVCSDGRPIWIHENVTLMRDRDGHPKRTVAVILDITERKAAEEALRQSEERLRNANQELELRVSERTRNLQESEARLKDVATTAKERAEQLQQLTVQLSKVENEERRRLAAVLHDHVQQILVAAKMRVDLAISDVSDPTLVERLTEANRMLDESITAARLLSIELAPPLLHDQGLAATLEWLAGRMQEMHRLTVHTRVNPAANPSSDEKRDVLFQAARELLLNVVKHARVQEATMTLSKSGRKTKLEVVDNGVGFDVSKLSSDPQSFGHFHILERIRGLGGTFKVTSKPGQGTKATIILG